MAGLNATLKLRLDKESVDDGLKAVGTQAVRVQDRFMRMATAIQGVANVLGPIFRKAGAELGEFALKVAGESDILAPLVEQFKKLPDEIAASMGSGFDLGFAGGEAGLQRFTGRLQEESKIWSEILGAALGEQAKGEPGAASEAVGGGLAAAGGSALLEILKNQGRMLARIGIAPLAPNYAMNPPTGSAMEFRMPAFSALESLSGSVPEMQNTLEAIRRAVENPPESQ